MKLYEQILKNADLGIDAIENVKCAGITDEELITAKNIIERDTYYSRESISNIASEKLSILSEIAVIISFTVETKPLAILPQSRLAKSFIILVIIVLSVLGNFGNVSTTNVNILSSISKHPNKPM